jgi:hypothetical protein
MILCWILLEYWRDCKEIGKENLAVPLQERLMTYFLFVVLPAIVGLVKASVK